MSWRAWLGLPSAAGRDLLSDAQFVVLDTETSGFDLRNDRLLAIGAVRVRAAKLALRETFECTLRQCAPSSSENILIHGISGSEQLSGEAPSTALPRFLAFVGAAPLVAFHAAFDQRMLERALRSERLRAPPGAWFDLAEILPVLFPAARAAAQLDDWLLQFGITPPARHNALGDAAATAELLLIALRTAQRQGARDLRSLRKLVRGARWLLSRSS